MKKRTREQKYRNTHVPYPSSTLTVDLSHSNLITISSGWQHGTSSVAQHRMEAKGVVEEIRVWVEGCGHVGVGSISIPPPRTSPGMHGMAWECRAATPDYVIR